MTWVRRKADTTAREYGHKHQVARDAAAARHDPTDPCTRCGRPLGPMGPQLHYDHNDSRTGYLGFAHARCNTRAGALKGNALRRGRPAPSQPLRRSESW